MDLGRYLPYACLDDSSRAIRRSIDGNYGKPHSIFLEFNSLPGHSATHGKMYVFLGLTVILSEPGDQTSKNVCH